MEASFKQAWAFIGGVFAFHALLLVNGSYETLWWADVVMHTLGGVGAGLFAAAWLQEPRSIRGLISLLGIVALIGVSWEWFEFLLDRPSLLFPFIHWNLPLQQVGLSDTMFDLYFDLLGGLFAGLWRYRRIIGL